MKILYRTWLEWIGDFPSNWVFFLAAELDVLQEFDDGNMTFSYQVVLTTTFLVVVVHITGGSSIYLIRYIYWSYDIAITMLSNSLWSTFIVYS
jgi:hypothetical protein